MAKKMSLPLVLLISIFLWGYDVGNVFAVDIAAADSKFRRAIVLMENDPALAMIELSSAAKLNPRDPKIFVAMGQIDFKEKRYRDAIKMFEKALVINKDYAVAYSNLGYTYMTLKEWDKAIQNFRLILKYPNLTAPHFVYNAVGWAYYEKNEFKKSIDELRKAVKLKKNYAIAYYNLGLSLLGIDDFDQAIDEFKNAIKYQSDLVRADNQLALVYLKKKMKDEARKGFKKVIDLSPDSELGKEAKNYIDILG